MKEAVDLLYVEDNIDYIKFVGNAVRKINAGITYEYVTDGKDAFEYFQNSTNNAQCAKLILLDINLPGMNGFELLQKIRATPHLKYLPVIIFSTSENPEDIRKSYDNGANAYIVKPSGITSLTDTLKKICDFWLSINYCTTGNPPSTLRN